MAFYRLDYFDTAGPERKQLHGHLIETPSRDRAAGYVLSERERTGADILMQRVHTGDDGVAPAGYRFKSAQVWVERSADPGWVRQWFKED